MTDPSDHRDVQRESELEELRDYSTDEDVRELAGYELWLMQDVRCVWDQPPLTLALVPLLHNVTVFLDGADGTADEAPMERGPESRRASSK